MHPVLFHIGVVIIPSYGAMAAIGVLLALALAQRTARAAGVEANHMWNLCVAALLVALLCSRLLLVAVNWRDVTRHPQWLLALATIHHPLLAAAAALFGGLAALGYARWQHMPPLATADALAAPLALFAAMEQFGALLAGAGFGTESSAPWTITYTNPLAARWSGAPIGVPLHPVQAYAALAALVLAALLLVILRRPHQPGDCAGAGLFGAGVAIYVTEFWRDWEGRGSVLRGFLDGPQIAAIVLVIAGALLLRERRAERNPAETGSSARHG